MCGHHHRHARDPLDVHARRAPAREPDWTAQPDLRASDAEREEVVTLLRDHGAAGRLSVEELDERLDRAYAARTRAELLALLRDLPRPARAATAAPPHRRGRHHRGPHPKALREQLRVYALVSVLLVVIWLATGAGAFWPAWALLGWGAWLVPAVLVAHARRGRTPA